MTHSVTDNFKSRDASASKKTALFLHDGFPELMIWTHSNTFIFCRVVGLSHATHRTSPLCIITDCDQSLSWERWAPALPPPPPQVTTMTVSNWPKLWISRRSSRWRRSSSRSWCRWCQPPPTPRCLRTRKIRAKDRAAATQGASFSLNVYHLLQYWVSSKCCS